jgi:DNA-binding ferritin-like protein
MRAEQLIDSMVGAEDAWCRLLGAAYGLYTLSYVFHWKTKGEQYYGDHLLYERLYQATFEDIDPIAEKAIGTTGESKFVTVSSILSRAAFYCGGYDTDNADLMPPSLLSAEQYFISITSNVLNELKAEGKSSTGVEAFLSELVNKHEGHVYLLRQRARTEESNY